MTENTVVAEMIEDLRKGKEIYTGFTEAIRSRMHIHDKTIDDWKDYFRIDIPENPNMEECKKIDVVLMEKYQEASFYKAMADATHTLHKNGYETHYRKTFTDLVDKYRAEGAKLPAKDTLENISKLQIKDQTAGLAHAEVAVAFWKEILSSLNFVRKIIENATINNSVEAKILDRNAT